MLLKGSEIIAKTGGRFDAPDAPPFGRNTTVARARRIVR